MRWGICIIIGALATGCASQKPQEVVQAPIKPLYETRASGSLAFDPPAIQGKARPNLSREGRALDAFVGYETLTTTYMYQRTDDRQSNDFGDHYEKRNITTKVGVSYR